MLGNLKRHFEFKGFSRTFYVIVSLMVIAFLSIYFKFTLSNNPLNQTTSAVSNVKYHVFKFYLAPSLVPDLNFAKSVLPKYIADMNFVLAKNTNRQFTFDPNTGIVLTSTKPHTDNYSGNIPLQGYDVWSYATQSALGYSWDGYMGLDQSGAAVLAGFKWLKLYDPDTLSPNTNDMHDYWVQIDHMLHEYAHVYGAGVGEYYNMATINDTTGVTPLQDIRLINFATDPFWTQRTQYYFDPLLGYAYGQPRTGNITSRQELLNAVTYSPLTAAIMNGDYRNPQVVPPTVDLNNLVVKVLDKNTQLPLSNANVKIWKISSIYPDPSSLYVNAQTDSQGQITFSWQNIGDPHDNTQQLHLVKVYKAGYTDSVQYISIYDTDEAKMLRNQNNYVLTVSMDSNGSAPTPTPTSTPIPTTTPTPTPTITPTPTPSPTPIVLTNLIINPGFELDTNNDGKPDNWTSDSHVSRSSALFHLGQYSIKHSDSKGASYNTEQVITNILPNTPYSFSGFVNVPSTSNAFSFQLRIVWGGKSGTIRTDTVKKYSKSTSGWDLAKASLVSPAGTTKATIRMQVNSLKATVYADDFSFSR